MSTTSRQPPLTRLAVSPVVRRRRRRSHLARADGAVDEQQARAAGRRRRRGASAASPASCPGRAGSCRPSAGSSAGSRSAPGRDPGGRSAGCSPRAAAPGRRSSSPRTSGSAAAASCCGPGRTASSRSAATSRRSCATSTQAWTSLPLIAPVASGSAPRTTRAGTPRRLAARASAGGVLLVVAGELGGLHELRHPPEAVAREEDVLVVAGRAAVGVGAVLHGLGDGDDLLPLAVDALGPRRDLVVDERRGSGCRRRCRRRRRRPWAAAASTFCARAVTV